MSWRVIILCLVFVMSGSTCAQTRSVTITEPGTYEIGELFKAADTVALVHILSGDAENYDCAVYKGKVVQSFKGTQAGAIIYFGPFVGYKVGDDYFVFLRNADQPISPKTSATTSYGAIPYAKVFDEGYSSMETSYACVFDANQVLPQCDYAVRVCTDYIKLPKSMETFPPEENDAPFGCRWVRKTGFLSLLDRLAGPKK